MKLAWLRFLPAGLRTKLIEGGIKRWLRQHGAPEGLIMRLLDGYATKLLALGGIFGGAASAIMDASAGHWEAAGQGMAAMAAGAGLLGWRIDTTWLVKFASALAGTSAILLGAGNGWDLGAMLKGWGVLSAALTALGVYNSKGEVAARAARRTQRSLERARGARALPEPVSAW